MKNTILYSFLISLTLLSACSQSSESTESTEATETKPQEKVKGPNIVFVAGEGKYRSEQSMPMLARLAERELNAKVTVCYPMDSDGNIDSQNPYNIPGLEALESADLMVLFIHNLTLPDEQLEFILKYVESGKPIVGFRSALHPFKYENDLEKGELNEQWPVRVFGQKWIADHGYFGDSKNPLTEVNLYSNQKDHPVLRGFRPFMAHSSLYHVEGNGDQLSGDCEPILTGRSLRSNYAESQEFPLDNPVAWIKTYTGKAGTQARIFFSTLGHPFDFKEPSMRKLSMNAIAWAVGWEANIPAEGFEVEVTDYAPDYSASKDKVGEN